jgi:hypothetical protein
MGISETGASRLINKMINVKQGHERQMVSQSAINLAKNILPKYFELITIIP